MTDKPPCVTDAVAAPGISMSRSTPPVVAVLLASHNGALWLEEQLQSIVGQVGVGTMLTVSDDASTDGTLQILSRWQGRLSLQVLPPSSTPMGSANRNFLRLIRDAPVADAGYVALADQDDIWKPAKLSRAVEAIEGMALDAYSSNVLAFWADGRRRVLWKSQAARRFDHLFESAGPGCTFVLRRAAFDRLRDWVTRHFHSLQEIKVHDWLIYALARSRDWNWYIDPWPSVLYRQHAHNEIGANVGARAAIRRLRHSRDGTYRSDVLAVARAVGDTSWVVEAMSRNAFADRLRLMMNVRQLRRRPRDRWAMLAVLVLMGRT